MKTVVAHEVRLTYGVQKGRFDFGYGSPGGTSVNSHYLPGNFSISYHTEDELVSGRCIELERNILGIYKKEGFLNPTQIPPTIKT